MNASSSDQVRIVLADDHRMFREGLRRLLDAEPDLVVIGEAGNAEEAVALTLGQEPDILLLDVAMPDDCGISVIEQITAASKATRVILVTGAIDDSELLRALHLGARGFVLKESGATQLLESIRAVHSGEYFVGRECMANLMTAIRSLSASNRARNRSKPRDFGLTLRERQIVAAVVEACQNREIAEKLAISEKTVKHHLTNIFDKVGVSNRVELALFALHHHLDSTNV